MFFHSRKNVEKLRNQYPVGTKIRLICMDGEIQMPKGLKGEVTRVDDAEQVHVQWENGVNLAIVPNLDQFEIVH